MAKAEISGNSDLTPDLLELRFIIDWLMSVGVSSPRLAALFGTSPENIRRLKYFAVRQLEPSLITFVPDLEMVPSTAMHGGVGIRSHREILRRSEKPSPTLLWLEGMRQANPIYTGGGVGDAVMGWTNKHRWYRSGGAGVAGKSSNWWPNTKPAG